MHACIAYIQELFQYIDACAVLAAVDPAVIRSRPVCIAGTGIARTAACPLGACSAILTLSFKGLAEHACKAYIHAIT